MHTFKAVVAGFVLALLLVLVVFMLVHEAGVEDVRCDPLTQCAVTI